LVAGGLCGGGSARGQSLFLQPTPVVMDEMGEPDAFAEARRFSLMLVEPPDPPTFERHDIVYIIVEEVTSAQSSQTLETSREFENSASLNNLIDPMEALQLRLRAGDTQNLDLIDVESESEFTGEGDYGRDDRIRSRIAATVVDVKPNGTLVLEATKEIVTDGEGRTMVLTGVCRQEDITAQNTILSSQMADLKIDMQHSGELRKAAKKGIFTRVIETLFNF